ncbi:MAG: DMT family transporter [Acidimicrobiia bacterium]|nr:DMT family transporter [Acidimicrobiia bacterium]
MSTPPAQGRIWSVFLLISIGWGTGGVMTRVAFDEGLESFAIVAISSTIAAVAVVVYAVAVRHGFSVGPLGWRVGAVMSVMSVTIPFLSRNFALQYASAGFVGLASALVPLATAITAHFMLPDEPLDRSTMTGLIVALSGVAVLVLSGDAGIGEGGRPALSGVLALAGVVSVALGGVYAKRHAGGYSPLAVAGVQFVFGAVITTVLMLVIEGAPANPTAAGWGTLGYIAIVSTFIPVALYYWLLRHVTVTYSAAIGYVIPLIAVAVGVIALDEQLQPGIVAGGALILAGVVLTDRARRRRATADAETVPPTSV